MEGVRLTPGALTVAEVAAPFTIRLPDRYGIERVIGRGGTAVVLAAFDQRLQRSVAVKVFTRVALTAEAIAMQDREAQVLAGLAHPGLVTVFDAGVDLSDPAAPHPYLVMERIDGPDLAQWLRTATLSARQVAGIGRELVSALMYVHARGLLHRDIKPSNVLLQLVDDGFVAKLSDFGIAVATEGEFEQGDFTVGTAAYLSPEQAEGHPLGAPSDVYALGLVLLEAITGTVAFPGPIIESALARLDRDPVVDDAIPRGLAEVLHGMTRREPAARMPLEEAHRRLSAFLKTASGGSRAAAPAPRAVTPVPTTRAGEYGRTGPEDAGLATLLAVTARQTGTLAAAIAVLGAGDPVIRAVHNLERGPLQRALSGIDSSPDGMAAAVLPIAAGDGTALTALSALPITNTVREPLGYLLLLSADAAPLDAARSAVFADFALLAGFALDIRDAARRALFSG